MRFHFEIWFVFGFACFHPETFLEKRIKTKISRASSRSKTFAFQIRVQHLRFELPENFFGNGKVTFGAVARVTRRHRNWIKIRVQKLLQEKVFVVVLVMQFALIKIFITYIVLDFEARWLWRAGAVWVAFQWIRRIVDVIIALVPEAKFWLWKWFVWIFRNLLPHVDLFRLESFFVFFLFSLSRCVWFFDESVHHLAVVADVKRFVFVIGFAQSTLKRFGWVRIVGDWCSMEPLKMFTFSDWS